MKQAAGRGPKAMGRSQKALGRRHCIRIGGLSVHFWDKNLRTIHSLPFLQWSTVTIMGLRQEAVGQRHCIRIGGLSAHDEEYTGCRPQNVGRRPKAVDHGPKAKGCRPKALHQIRRIVCVFSGPRGPLVEPSMSPIPSTRPVGNNFLMNS